MKKCIILTLLFLLFISTSLNICFWLKANRYYKCDKLLRIDPTETMWQKYSYFGHSQPFLYMIGDSLIARWKSLPNITQYGSIQNYGIGGQTSHQVLLRLDSYGESFTNNIVLVHVGTNDVMSVGVFPNRGDQIVKHCINNLNEIVRKTKQTGGHVVLLTVFPIGKPSLPRRAYWCDRILDARNQINEHIRQYADQPSVTVVDCDIALASAGRLNPKFAQDTLHLNDDGYRALNEHLEPIIKQVMELEQVK